MNTDNILTAIALGFGLLSGSLILDLLYKAMYTGNKNGISCIDCNSYGEGVFEVVLVAVMVIITLYAFIISLNRMV